MVATADELVERAVDRVGLSDFGPDGWRIGLEHLIDGVASDVGDDADAVDRIEVLLVERLVKRLRVEQWYAEHGDDASAPVEGMLLIAGMPRTATTALHYLLARDARLRHLRAWEVDDPVPPPDLATERDDPRRVPRASDAQHIRTVDGPVEDARIVEMSFTGTEFVLPVPSYSRWWRSVDHRTGYAYLDRMLRLLQCHRPPRHWLLKYPSYLFDLEGFADQFPSARFVVTHRDPVEVVPSTCSVILAARRRRVPDASPDLAEFGREILGHWSEGMRRAMSARAVIGDDRFVDVAQADVASDPVGTAERILRFAGLGLSDDLRDAAEWAPEERPGGRGAHRVTPEDFGLTADGIRDAFSEYLAQYGNYCERPA